MSWLAFLFVVVLSYLVGEQVTRINQDRPYFRNYKYHIPRPKSPYAKTEELQVQPSLVNKTAVVSGAPGGLGTNIVEQLILDGWTKVVCLHRRSSNLVSLHELDQKFPGILEFKTVDMNNFEEIESAIPPETGAFFHTAAVVKSWQGYNDEMYQTNVLGTRKVVDACLKKNVQKLVLTSSVAVFLNSPANPITEETPHTGRNSFTGYAFTKQLQEEEVLAGIKDGQWATIVNPGVIVGKYDRNSFGRIFDLIDQGMPMPNAVSPWNTAVEIAKAHIAAAKVGRLGESYILGGNNHGMAEVTAIIAETLGKPAPFMVPDIVALCGGLVGDILAQYILHRDPDLTLDVYYVFPHVALPFSSAKAERELGYKVNLDIKQFVSEAVAWWKEDKEKSRTFH